MAGGYKTVVLKGRGIRKEALAAAAIQPGDLININSAGKYIRHATAGGKCGPVFAVENELFGKGIDVNYAADEQVLAEAVQSGAEIQANVAANAVAIVAGDLLESAGDGTLRKWVGPTDLTGTLTGTNDGALNDITFNATWSQGQADEINSNFEEIQAYLAGIGPQGVGHPVARALEALDNSAVSAIAQIVVEVL